MNNEANKKKKTKLIIAIILLILSIVYIINHKLNAKYIEELKSTPEGAIKASLLESNDISRKSKKVNWIVSCKIEVTDEHIGFYYIENPPASSLTGEKARYFEVSKNGDKYFAKAIPHYIYWEDLEEFEMNQKKE